MGFPRGGNDVCGAVEPSMTLLQATMTIVPRVVVLPLPVLRTAVVIFGLSSTPRNTLTSYTVTSTFVPTTTFMLCRFRQGACSQRGLALHYN